MVDILGGYRLVRTIGMGSRAEVLLAHPLRADAELEPAVIKVYGPGVSDESVFAEIEALARAAGDHVVRLLDVTTTENGDPALVLSRHAARSLARLLADRVALQPGEAITILAPLATALARLHSAGVAHGAIGPESVLFDAVGSPALACFGRATLFEPALPVARLECQQDVIADVLAFGALAGVVLDRAGCTDAAARARTEAAPGAWLGSFAESLFDLAEPLPVGVTARAEVEHVPLPARVVGTHPVVVGPSEAAPWRSMGERIRMSLRSVRRPVWVVAGAGAVAALIALVGVAASDDGSAVEPGTEATRSPASFAPVPGSDAAIGGDDPVRAAVVLVATREGCIRALSVECLDAVDQPGSSAAAADRELVRAALDGGELPAAIATDGASLVQRLGDSALIELGPDAEPASLLLSKGEAGWRIRDYLEE